jgi:hypothetical protein
MHCALMHKLVNAYAVKGPPAAVGWAQPLSCPFAVVTAIFMQNCLGSPHCQCPTIKLPSHQATRLCAASCLLILLLLLLLLQ